jgi:hypothetical protein
VEPKLERNCLAVAYQLVRKFFDSRQLDSRIRPENQINGTLAPDTTHESAHFLDVIPKRRSVGRFWFHLNYRVVAFA